MRKYKRKLNPPDWIRNLQPGEYTLDILVEITGLFKQSITPTILRYGAELKKVDSGYRNLSKNIFLWKGLQDYEEKSHVNE